MDRSLTLRGVSWPRILSFLAGLGMVVASGMTIHHFFSANFPTSIYQGSVCDIDAFFNCDSTAYSPIAEIAGVPLGYFGLFAGGLVCLGALFPSAAFERTNKSLALVNAVGVVTLFIYSVAFLGSLCLFCAGYYVFVLLSFALFWRYGIAGDKGGGLRSYLSPSLKHLATFAVVALAGAYGFERFHEAKKAAQSGGIAAQIVKQFFDLPKVKLPSLLSPYMVVKSTERFEDAPIQVVEYGDFLCPDCRFLFEQLQRLEKEFEGKINVAFQFFPLEAACNPVVGKNLHPGACELSYMAAYDPAKFRRMHDAIFSSFPATKDPGWRADFAKKHGVEAALQDEKTKETVHRLISTGAEYEKTSDQWAHGIRSTPTLIVNNRMIIGTYPYAQLRAVFKALVEAAETPEDRTLPKFLESWVS